MFIFQNDLFVFQISKIQEMVSFVLTKYDFFTIQYYIYYISTDQFHMNRHLFRYFWSVKTKYKCRSKFRKAYSIIFKRSHFYTNTFVYQFLKVVSYIALFKFGLINLSLLSISIRQERIRRTYNQFLHKKGGEIYQTDL